MLLIPDWFLAVVHIKSKIYSQLTFLCLLLSWTISYTGSDLQNGILGFIPEVQSGLILDEDSENREVLLTVTRQPNRCRQQQIPVLFPHSVIRSLESQELLLVEEVFITGFYINVSPSGPLIASQILATGI